GQGVVREEDVLVYLEEDQKADQAQPSAQEREPAVSSITSTDTPVAAGKGGIFQLVKEFLAEARSSAHNRGHSMIWLGFNYIFRNYLLGLLARISPLGVNLVIHRLRGVKLGKGVYIDPTSVLETAYPENITIGNDVRVTAYAVIMTHIKAPHHLRDTGIMPLVIKPVVLEDHCFIGVNVVIMPGVTVGKGAVVASGSVVITNVPPYTMVAGNPAKVVKRFR
ncbi:MAG: acyltransferase, partial [Nitrospira sp.]|nr:acyltransferase [Nitrospira sp.]